MRFIFTTNDKFDENMADLIKRGNHSSMKEVIIEALKRYDWILAEEKKGHEIVSIPQNPQPQPPKNKWMNENIRLVYSDKE